MGERQGWLLEPTFNRSIKLRQADPRISDNAGAQWVARHQRAADGGRKVLRGTLDVDPFPIEVHGRQPGGACNGYYRKTIYHPIVASFSAEGSYESQRLGEGFIHAMLRRGNCGSAEGAARFIRQALPGTASM